MGAGKPVIPHHSSQPGLKPRLRHSTTENSRFAEQQKLSQPALYSKIVKDQLHSYQAAILEDTVWRSSTRPIGGATRLGECCKTRRLKTYTWIIRSQEVLLPPGRGGSVGIDKQKRAEDISKDVSAFLNSDGGVLVYGVPESISPDDTGGSPVPGGAQVGFTRGEIDKETIENLITSNIQPKPSPDLFQVVEVPYGSDGRLVFIVEVAAGFGDVWQARDKRYYRTGSIQVGTDGALRDQHGEGSTPWP